MTPGDRPFHLGCSSRTNWSSANTTSCRASITRGVGGMQRHCSLATYTGSACGSTETSTPSRLTSKCAAEAVERLMQRDHLKGRVEILSDVEVSSPATQLHTTKLLVHRHDEFRCRYQADARAVFERNVALLADLGRVGGARTQIDRDARHRGGREPAPVRSTCADVTSRSYRATHALRCAAISKTLVSDLEGRAVSGFPPARPQSRARRRQFAPRRRSRASHAAASARTVCVSRSRDRALTRPQPSSRETGWPWRCASRRQLTVMSNRAAISRYFMPIDAMQQKDLPGPGSERVRGQP